MRKSVFPAKSGRVSVEYERAIVSVLNAFVRKRMNEYIGAVERYVKSRLLVYSYWSMRLQLAAPWYAEAYGFPA